MRRRLRGAAAASVAVVGVALCGAATPAWAQSLPDAAVTEYKPQRVAQELERFKALGDGILLTLAACKEQPHCATAISRHELERLLNRIQRRIEHLEKERRSDGLDEPYTRFLAQYKRLRARYTEQLEQVQKVTQRIDTDALKKDWEELLSFEAKTAQTQEKGPKVPAPNKNLQLKRFADVTEPIPIE